ncbi:DgyrCDS3508 [Dimorphilus gyrociliatus]|uniref:DgyrCDS3508 n=1 Tax=Dimorphilus gyrociliatus TaxID=2664684 RepID=A0A7I8VE01_9ANNE|nr:DgyrCDS3508 [Dimorphilus gyrociliatus]
MPKRLNVPYFGVAMSKKFEYSYYEILGLTNDATKKQVKDAYVKLSKQVHPDVNRSDPKSHDKFVEVQEAYRILSSPTERQQYDASLATRGMHNRPIHATEYHQSRPYTQQGENNDIYNEEMQWYARSQQKFYYGSRKRSKPMVVIFGLGLIALGMALHTGAYTWSCKHRKEIMDERDKINFAHLNRSREQARTLGNTIQLELIQQRWKEDK